MPEYAPGPARGAFALSRAYFEEMVEWLAGVEAAGLTNISEVEIGMLLAADDSQDPRRTVCLW